MLDVYRVTAMQSLSNFSDVIVQVPSLTQDEPLALCAPSPEELAILKGIDKGDVLSSGAPQITKDGTSTRNSAEYTQLRRSKLGSREDLSFDDSREESNDNTKDLGGRKMGTSSKRSKKVEESESNSEFENDELLNEMSDDAENFDVDHYNNEDESGEQEEEEDEAGDQEEEEREKLTEEHKIAEMEELEKEYMELKQKEQDLLKNLTQHKDEDLLKGQAIKNQKALWDKTLELRFLLQKPFSNSNRLPQEPIRSSFCDSDDTVKDAYSDLLDSSRKTLDSILELQEVLLEKNRSITQSMDVSSGQRSKLLEDSVKSGEVDDDWLKISQMHSRMAAFRDKSIDKWQRKTQVTSGAAAIKGKLQAFNQDISQQVAGYMRDPSKMIKGMQQSRSAVALFGTVPDATCNGEGTTMDGNPELLDDSEFYQQLLKEFFEAVDPASSETAFYALKRLQTKKRKIVDRRASKSRKIRYNIHEKIVNFMAPQPVNLPEIAPKLFENLFSGGSTRPLA